MKKFRLRRNFTPLREKKVYRIRPPNADAEPKMITAGEFIRRILTADAEKNPISENLKNKLKEAMDRWISQNFPD